jgi:outer membrane protein
MLMMSLAAGCAVDQAREVATYRAVLDGPDPTTAPVIPIDGPLSLVDALRLANAHNEQLAIRGEDYLQALIEKNRAAGAFLPTIGLSGSYSLQDAGDGFIVDDNFLEIDNATDQTSLSANAGMNVFNGGGDVATLKQRAATAEQRRNLVLDEQASVLLNVSQTYYGVIQSERSAEVLENTILLQEERVRDTTTRVELGIARPLDQAQSQADLASTRASLVEVRNNVDTGRATLAFLIGQEAVDGPLIDAYDVPEVVVGRDEWQGIANDHRPDLAAAIKQVEAARHRVDAAFAQYFPSVSIDFQQLLYVDPDSTGDWSGALIANLPIFSAGQIEADVRTAWSQYRQAALNESSVRREIRQDVRNALTDFSASRQRIIELDAAVIAAREAYRLADESYRLGNATNLERLDAQDTLLNAELQLVREQFAHKSDYLALLRAVGLLDADTLRDDPPTTGPSSRPATGPLAP